MKIIDLLNKIANNEDVPEFIEFKGDIYILNDNIYKSKDGYSNLFSFFATELILNDEVEILQLRRDKNE